MRRSVFAALVSSALVVSALAGAATPPPVRFPVTRTALESGLRVVTLADHASPTVAIELVYDAGERREERGRGGLARLVGHLASHSARDALVADRGGEARAQVDPDLTRFSTVLPASELALGLWLEAERMRSLDVSQASLDAARTAVTDAYRAERDAAYGAARDRLLELTFQGYWPYEAHHAIRELDAADLGAVRAFHAQYYRPSNAVLVVAGDFDEAECLALVRRYFAAVAPQERPPRPKAPAMPEQTAPRAAVVEDARAPFPQVTTAWVVPPSREPDHYALEVAAQILGDGEAARLPRQLVRARSLVIDATARVGGRLGPDSFEITLRLPRGGRTAEAAKELDAQLSELAKNGPSTEELRRARARLVTGALRRLQSSRARAEALAAIELAGGDASGIDAELERAFAVGAADVRRVVAKYLTASRKNTVEVKAALDDEATK